MVGGLDEENVILDGSSGWQEIVEGGPKRWGVWTDW